MDNFLLYISNRISLSNLLSIVFYLLNYFSPQSHVYVTCTQGTDSGVDTYFGLCTYPGRELRHRIDLKVQIVAHSLLYAYKRS